MRENLRRLLIFILLGLALPVVSMHWAGLPKEHSIDDLAWLAGFWRGSQGETVTEELWTTAVGGAMIGIHRDLLPSGKVFFEYLRIVESGEGITYHASPMGRQATPFRLKSLKSNRVVFSNPRHDYPQEISYWLDSNGKLHAEISGVRSATKSRSEWVWDRVPFPGK